MPTGPAARTCDGGGADSHRHTITSCHSLFPPPLPSIDLFPHQPLEVEPRHEHLCPVSVPAKHAVCGHDDVVEDELGCVAAAHTKLVKLGAGGEAG